MSGADRKSPARPEKREYAVYTFETTHAVLEAEQALKGEGITVITIPKPESLGGYACGIALRVPVENVPEALAVFAQHGAKCVQEGRITDF